MDIENRIRNLTGIVWDHISPLHREGTYLVEKNKLKGVFSFKESKLIVPAEFETVSEPDLEKFPKKKRARLTSAYAIEKNSQSGLYFTGTQKAEWDRSVHERPDQYYLGN